MIKDENCHKNMVFWQKKMEALNGCLLLFEMQ
jgi:hypothetical protein